MALDVCYYIGYHKVMSTSGILSVPAEQRIGIGEIRTVVRQIAERFSPHKVILFGSYAAGQPTADSDVDLLVITDRPGGADASLKIRRAIDYSFPIDIIVYNPKQLTARIDSGDYFVLEAIENGKVLYERPQPFAINQV